MRYIKLPRFINIYAFKYNMATLSTGMLNSAIIAIVLLVVLFQLYSTLVPEAQTAGNMLNESGVPLGSLFTGNGVVFIIVMASLVIVVVTSFMGGLKGKK
jgi:hypothetical protein